MEQEKIDLYNPANAKSLTAEEVAAMQDLTKDEIKALAEAYPNGMKSYLILKDKTLPDNKQLFHRSTWQNYWALLKAGQKNYVVMTFVSLFKPEKHSLKVAPAQDITSDDVKKNLATASSQSGSEVNTGSAEEQTGAEKKDPPPADKKPLDKMNKKELLEEYQLVFGQPANEEELTTNKSLQKAIQAKLDEVKQ